MSTCTNCQKAFEVTKEDLAFYAKIEVPQPAICPDCRNQRRLLWRNDQNYYHGTCHLCHKKLITIYSPDKKIPVLCHGCFWSDAFNPLDYGRDMDFTRPFFEQFQQMRATVPRLAIYNTQSENSEYTVHSGSNRNCYLASSLVDCEDVHYSDWAMECKDCTDLLFCTKMERCYQCIDCEACFNTDYATLCFNVTDSFLCFDCRSSENLIGCVGLRNKREHILNQPATKEECEKLKIRLRTDPEFFLQFQAEYKELKKGVPQRATWIIKSENCFGDSIYNSKNVTHGFNVRNTEDGKFLYDTKNAKDCYDISRVANATLLYQCQAIIELYDGKFCNLVYHSANMTYCDNCQNCNDCFGSFSLKKHRYCILNKQYTKEEYEALVPKIIQHMKSTAVAGSNGAEWGQFLPAAFSPFGYNESKAQEFYPLTQEEAKAQGFNWCDYQQESPKVEKTLTAKDIPTSITDVSDDILNHAIVCEVSKRPFKIVPAELKFYRSKGLPIPHISPQERHKARIATKKSRTLYDRECDKCKAKIQTISTPGTPGIIYCEKCYLDATY